MFFRRTNLITPSVVYSAIPSTLFSADFCVVSWLRKTSTGNFQISWQIRDASNDICLESRIGGGSNNTVGARIYNTGGVNFSSNALLGADAIQNAWLLQVVNFIAATPTINSIGVSDAAPAGVQGSNPTVLSTLRTPANITLSSTMEGLYGMICIRPGNLALADAVAMFATKERSIPLTYDDGLEDDDVICFNVGVAQIPQSADSVSTVNGKRIGSAAAEGDYLVYRRGSGIDQSGNLVAARPVTISNVTYEYEDDFFTPQLDGGTNIAVQNSQVMARWANNQPSRLHRIAIWGNSRTVRPQTYAEVAPQTQIPFGYAGSWWCGLSLHHLNNFAGALGVRIQDSAGDRWPVFDTWDTVYFTSGTVSTNTGTDPARGYLNSANTTGPNTVRRLLTDGTISIKARSLPGSKFTSNDAIKCSVFYLRAPGASDFNHRAVEATAQNVEGTFTGSLQSTTDADTGYFTHSYDTGAGDSYTAGTRTLIVNGLPASPDIIAGDLITIVAGTGIRSIGQVLSVVNKEITIPDGDANYTLLLKHEFDTAPVSGSSVFSFGPYAIGEAVVDCPASAEEFRGIWVQHPGAPGTNKIGVHLFAASAWNPSARGFAWAMCGWGGNGLVPQTDDTFNGVPAEMVRVLGVESTWITDAYQGTTIDPDFANFAALIEPAGTEVVFVSGQANSETAASENNYRTFIAGQSLRPGITVTRSPLIGSQLEQLAYAGKQNGAHPSIETFARVAEALAGFAQEEFFFTPEGGRGSRGRGRLLMDVR